MAACYESMMFEQCRSALAFIVGMKISKTWQGAEPCLFLELGRLRRVKTPHGTSLKGRATIMMQSVWRVDGPRSISFGSLFGAKARARRLSDLVGTAIDTFEIDGATRELVLSLSDGKTLRTFTEYTSQPQWVILVKDCALLELDGVWAGTDVTPCFHMYAGRPQIEYCFDESEANLRELRRKYRFPRTRG